MAYGQVVMPPLRDALLKLVRNCVSPGSVRKVCRAMKACPSGLLSMSVSFSKGARRSKNRSGAYCRRSSS